LWLPGEYVVDTYEIPAVDGGWALRVGWYSPEDGTRLARRGAAQNAPEDYAQIGF
jgi:hypothetical protein